MVAAAAPILVATAIGAAGCGSGAATPSTSESPASTEKTAVKRAGGEAGSKLRAQVVNFGREGSRGELEDATVVVRAYFRAQADEDWAEACSLLARWLRSTARQIASGVGMKGCAAGAETMASASAGTESTLVDSRSLRRRGKRTFVIYTNEEGNLMAMLMRPEGGEWKIAGSGPNFLGATP